MTRVGLLGGAPFQRDLLHGWIRKVEGVRTVVGLVLGRSDTAIDVDLLVAVLEDSTEVLGVYRSLRDRHRRCALVAILPTPSDTMIVRACAAGASAIVAAASGPDALGTGIRAAMHGGAWLDPALSPFVLDRITDRIGGDDNRHGLTAKEMQVARCFPDGLSNREIAGRLGITEHTVKTHVRNIYRKLDVNDRAAAASLLGVHQRPRRLARSEL